jgi:hypothetical protein
MSEAGRAGGSRARSTATCSPAIPSATPRLGGYCTGGLSLGYKMIADPENWYIVYGQLHLHHTKEGRDKAVVDPRPVITKAEETWTRLGQTADGQETAADPDRQARAR